MIGVTFKGRLGNQLFQYTFLRYLKENNPDKIVFTSNPHHTYFAKYFELTTLDNLTISSKIYSAVTRVLPGILPFKEIYIQNFVSPRPIRASNFSIYHGYYQTDWYYNQLKQKPNFTIKEKYTKKFDQEFGALFRDKKTIVVHIRRTDYLNYGKRDISLPIEHFQRQLNAIDDLDSFKVFFVSDDIEFVKKNFPARDNFIFSNNDEIIDFQLIQNADIAIISNSSFAWWAGFLSPKKNKVIAPKNWMGFRIGAVHPKGVMTDKFTWVEV